MTHGTVHSDIILLINEDRCHVCGKCLAKAACHHGAIRTIDRGEAPVVDTSQCWRCLTCLNACPFGAVTRRTGSDASPEAR
jgi:Fe-S-cluster-containing hydrogenase component 2